MATKSTRIGAVNLKYRTPAKRGTTIRYPHKTHKADAGLEGRILSATGMHFNVLLSNGERLTVHPFGLDYSTANGWVIGAELQREYDGAWDRWNGRLSAVVGTGG